MTAKKTKQSILKKLSSILATGLIMSLLLPVLPARAADPIDIGSGATDRSSSNDFGFNTVIDTNNPADGSGWITDVSFYFVDNTTGIYVGVFYLVSGTTFHCRSAAYIGDITAGSVQSFPVYLQVEDGDFIGFYSSASSIVEYDGFGGVNLFQKPSNTCVLGNESSYTQYGTGRRISLYGTGTIGDVTIGDNFSSDLGLWEENNCTIGNGYWEIVGGEVQVATTDVAYDYCLFFKTLLPFQNYSISANISTNKGLTSAYDKIGFEHNTGISGDTGGVQHSAGWEEYTNKFFIWTPNGKVNSPADPTFNASINHNFELQVIGNTWSLYVDGDLKVTQTDSWRPTFIGLYVEGQSVDFVGTFDDFVLEELPPFVVTLPVSDVDTTSVTLGGNVTSSVDERGFEWSTETGVYSSNWTESGSFGAEEFTHNVTSLLLGTTYYYRAMVHDDVGWGYGEEIEFTTLSTVSSVTTLSATDVYMNGGTHVTLRGSLDDLGGAPTCDIWFEWGYDTSYGSTVGTQTVITTGTYTTDISGYNPTETIYYRFVGENVEGTTYGVAQTFLLTGGAAIAQRLLYGAGLVVIASTILLGVFLAFQTGGPIAGLAAAITGLIAFKIVELWLRSLW